MEVLNEQALWTSDKDSINWLASLLGREPVNSPQVIEDFQTGLNKIRRQVTSLHFHEPFDFTSLDAELRNIRLELVDPAMPPDGYGSFLPLLHARLHGNNDDSFLIALKETLIVQFAHFVAESLNNSESPGVARCEGLYREGNSTHLSPAQSLPTDIELKWRKEIAVLTDSGLESSPEILRCADYFPTRAKGRFCSDECRFRTFQLTKQLSDPGYLAAKQKRYRARQVRQKD
jgi:hypothetical protein